MNIHLMRLKSVVRELRGIREELARLGDCWEQELSQQGIRMRPPVVDTSGPEPSMSYVDEELGWIDQGFLSTWDDRQPDAEDPTAAERQKRSRQRKKEQRRKELDASHRDNRDVTLGPPQRRHRGPNPGEVSETAAMGDGDDHFWRASSSARMMARSDSGISFMSNSP